MSLIAIEPVGVEIEPASYTSSDYDTWRWYVLPLIFAFAIDLLAPQLIAWRLIPRAVLWLGDLAIVIMIAVGLIRMLLLDKIPVVFLIVIATALIGTTVALFEGQGIVVTAYGLRTLFQYPLVGLYVYMMPQWPPRSATWLLRVFLFLLAINVVFQFMQSITGQGLGDNTAGMFGFHGVAPLSIYTFMIVSFGLGKWLTKADWRYLAAALALGAIASVIGEMKLFPVAVVLLVLFATVVQLLRGKQMRRLFSLVALTVVIVAAFGYFFSVTYAKSGMTRYYLDSISLNDYLNRTYSSSRSSGFSLGRNSEPAYIWRNNTQNPTRFLFGRGIGSRSQSRTFGLAGNFYSNSLYQSGHGFSLSVFLQETGVVGLLTFAAFCIAMISALYKKALKNEPSDLAAIQYGLLLFTILWPLWLWYLSIWLLAVPMLLYWSLLGFALNEDNNRAVEPG